MKEEILSAVFEVPYIYNGSEYPEPDWSVLSKLKANADDELTYRFIQYIEEYNYSFNAEHCKEHLEIMREKFAHARKDAKFRAIFLRELRSLT